jgi:hypothetical protein
MWWDQTISAFTRGELFFLFVSNQQSQYRVFHELMCWLSLTFRLSNVMSPIQRGDLLIPFLRSDEGP